MVEPATAAQPHRFEALDSLRGVCACMVVLHHVPTNGFTAAAFFRHGFMFVDFFFVLSGFVIASSYGRKLEDGFSPARYMGLRLGRVYPLYAVMLLLFLAFELLFATGLLGSADRRPFEQGFEPTLFVACLLLVQPFVGPDGTPWNRPSWSISVEVWTYLIFALLFRWCGRLLVPAALAIAAVAAFHLARMDPRYISVVHDGALARCLLGFALGVVAERAHAPLRRRAPTGAVATGAELLAVAAVIGFIARVGIEPASVAAPFLFCLAVSLFALERGAVSRLLLTRPLRRLGLLSYSIYMVHMFLVYRAINALGLARRISHGRIALVETVDGANQIGGGALFGDCAALALLALVVGCATLTYRWIERPAQGWSRRRILGDHPRRTTLAAEAEAPTF